MPTYPLNVPDVGITSLTWTNTNVSVISRSPFTLQGQVQSYPGQLRYASVTVSDVMRDQAEEWIGFLDSMNGSRGTFLMGDPMGTVPRGLGTGNVTGRTVRPAGTGLLFLKTDATPLPNQAPRRFLERGDWLQIGTGLNARLYKTIVRSSHNTTGEISVEVWPNLRSTLNIDEPVFVRNTVGLFRLSTGTYDYTEDNGCKYTISFNCEEVI